ncbi:MAG: hypothetical protein AABM30_04280 [Actinomycetota bacterium]
MTLLGSAPAVQSRAGCYARLGVIAAVGSLVAACGSSDGENPSNVTGRNGKIAFQAFSDASRPSDGIYLINPDGSGRSRLKGQPAESAAPRWSPDGQRLLLTVLVPTANTVALDVINADGTHLKSLLVGRGEPADGYPGYADWSPDGRKLVFIRGRLCSKFICDASLNILDLSTHQVRRLVNNVLGLSPPAWSPDGRLIAFTRNRQIWLVTPDGRNPKALTSLAGLNLYPSWSPDGSRLAFTQIAHTTIVYTIGADGHHLQRLLQGANEAAAAWSPDGRRFVYVHDGLNSGDIYAANRDGTAAMPLTHDRSDETLPDWQPLP